MGQPLCSRIRVRFYAVPVFSRRMHAMDERKKSTTLKTSSHPKRGASAAAKKTGRSGRPNDMVYRLKDFCTELTASIKSEGIDGLPAMAEKLQELLVNPEFVAETFSDDTPPGKQILFHDPETDVYVQAHVQSAGKRSKPHSHGASWAIYGNARGYTRMNEWERLNSENEDHAVLKSHADYRLGPGEARVYGPNVIHSTEHPEKAWVIRVLGTDLNSIPRYRFNGQTDKIEAAA
jgi:predicted metal-dependent enzyme (double-stranded beta helix superfamily)